MRTLLKIENKGLLKRAQKREIDERNDMRKDLLSGWKNYWPKKLSKKEKIYIVKLKQWPKNTL